MKIPHRFAALMTTLALSAGFVIASSSSASALSGCQYGVASDGVNRVVCSSGTGQVRAWIGCQSVWRLGYAYTKNGPWVGRGQVSAAGCGAGEWPWVINGRVASGYENRG